MDENTLPLAQTSQATKTMKSRQVHDRQTSRILKGHPVRNNLHRLHQHLDPIRKRPRPDKHNPLPRLDVLNTRSDARDDARALTSQGLLIPRDDAHGDGDVLEVESRGVDLDLGEAGGRRGQALGGDFLEADGVEAAAFVGDEADGCVAGAGVGFVGGAAFAVVVFCFVEAGVFVEAGDVDEAVALDEFAVHVGVVFDEGPEASPDAYHGGGA
jgi:hypothetical protein